MKFIKRLEIYTRSVPNIISLGDRKSRTTCHLNVNKTVLSPKKKKRKNGGRHDSKDDCFHKIFSNHVKFKKNYSSVKFWIHWIDGEYFLGSVKINVSNRLGFWPLQSSWTSIGQSKVQTATGSCCSDNR